MTKQKVFYFVAQRGVMRDQSMMADNFYQYTIPEKYRDQVLSEAEQAKLGSAGLEYSVEFLKNLNKWDREGLNAVRTRSL